MKSGAAAWCCPWLPPFGEFLSRGSQVRVLPGARPRDPCRAGVLLARRSAKREGGPGAIQPQGEGGQVGRARSSQQPRRSAKREGGPGAPSRVLYLDLIVRIPPVARTVRWTRSPFTAPL